MNVESQDAITQKAESIACKVYRNYLSSDMKQFKGWHSIPTKAIKSPETVRSFIAARLQEGARVSGGYYCTSIPQVHNYYIFWKEKHGTKSDSTCA